MTDELNPDDFVEGELKDCAKSLNKMKVVIEIKVGDDRHLFDPVTGKFMGAPDGVKPFIMDKESCNRLDTVGSVMQDRYFILDEHKNIIPATCSQWSMWFSTPYSKYLYRTYFDKDIFLSTVFLGLDHGWNMNKDPDYRPVLFETMLMDEKQDFMVRYCTYDEATLGHAAAVEHVLNEYDLTIMD